MLQFLNVAADLTAILVVLVPLTIWFLRVAQRRQDERRHEREQLEARVRALEYAVDAQAKLLDDQFHILAGVLSAQEEMLRIEREASSQRIEDTRRRMEIGEMQVRLLDGVLDVQDDVLDLLSRLAQSREQPGALLGTSPESLPQRIA